MVYSLLAAGVIISIISIVRIGRAGKLESEAAVPSRPGPEPGSPVEPGEKEAFSRYLSESSKRVPDAGAIYELKERVEMQLTEIREQKELITYLMMKVEKKLDGEELRREDSPERAAPKKEGLSEDSLERVRLHNDIYLLYDQGIPLVEIARQLGRGKGEVQLILGLRN